MRKTLKINGGYSVSYLSSMMAKDKIFDKLIAYFTKHELWCGESIEQSDECAMTAPELLSDICDKILKTKYIEIEND